MTSDTAGATLDDPACAGLRRVGSARLNRVAERSFRGNWWAWIVLAISLSLSGLAFYAVKSQSESAAAAQFEFRKAEITDAIERRMVAYTQSLYGGLGLFRASEQVSRAEWRTYVDSLDLERHFPGIQGMGYTRWVTPEQRGAYEAEIRAEGFPDFTIRPPESREIYTSITFLEPFDERNRQAFGYDMFSQETRRAAMMTARDSGQVAISGRVQLVQEITDDVQSGFLMYVPFYGNGDLPESIADRRARSEGFVYSPFRMGDLMEGILGLGLPDVRLQIFDGGSLSLDDLMFDSHGDDADRQHFFTATEEITFGQRKWTLHVTSLPSFEERIDRQKSYIVLIAGLAASLLFFAVLWAFSSTRARAESLAEEMTVTIAKRSRDLARSNGELEQFAYIASHDLKAPLRGIDHLAVWIEKDLGDNLNGEPKQNMALLRNRVKRLDALLDDLLNYSRAARIDAAIEIVDIRQLINEQFDMIRAGREFEISIDTTISTFAIRRSAVEQVLANLFSNAIKHHDSPPGRLTVSARDVGDKIEFVITDDGPGIPTELRDRAFQMFQTLQPRDQVEGSGMGLAIILKIIEHYGGTVTIEDPPGGRGASFRIMWPKT